MNDELKIALEELKQVQAERAKNHPKGRPAYLGPVRDDLEATHKARIAELQAKIEAALKSPN